MRSTSAVTTVLILLLGIGVAEAANPTLLAKPGAFSSAMLIAAWPGFRLTPGFFGAFPPCDQRALWNTGISCGKGYVTLSVLRSLWQAGKKSAGRDLLRGEP